MYTEPTRVLYSTSCSSSLRQVNFARVFDKESGPKRRQPKPEKTAVHASRCPVYDQNRDRERKSQAVSKISNRAIIAWSLTLHPACKRPTQIFASSCMSYRIVAIALVLRWFGLRQLTRQAVTGVGWCLLSLFDLPSLLWSCDGLPDVPVVQPPIYNQFTSIIARCEARR